MRLTIILMTVGLLQVHAKSLSQSVTLSGQDIPIQEVFAAIESQTGYSVFGNLSLLGKARPVSVDARDMKLEDFLSVVMEDQPFKYTLSDRTIILGEKPRTESLNSRLTLPSLTPPPITGIVRGPDGQPVVGANIIVKGTKKGTTTNADGSFSIEANKGDVIIVSSVGYVDRRLTIDDNSLGVISLPISESKLDEVQIIAYGQTSQRVNPGNVVTIKSDEISKQPVNNPLYALQGRVAGMIISPTSGLPGSPVTVQIRGQNSLTKGSDPLYVVDGLPYTGTIQPSPSASGVGALSLGISPLNFINPNDIESISILKDADATAIYGSRGSNGVILINTKKGKPGITKVDINIQSGISQVSKKLKTMDTQQYLAMRKEALTNDDRINRLNDPANAITYSDLMLWDQNQYTNWQDVLIGNTAKYTDIQSSISGGSDIIQYLIGANYHRETTVFPGNNADTKGGAHFSITGNSNNRKLRTMLTGSYMSDKSTLPGIDFTNQSLTIEPNAPSALNADGTVNWALYPATGENTTWFISPYSSQLLSQFEYKTNNLTTSAEISYRLSDNITVKANTGYNELRTNFFQGIPLTSFPPSYASFSDLRTANYSNNLVKNLTVEPQITYSGNLFQGKLEGLVGSAFQSSIVEGRTLILYDFSSDLLLKSQDAAVSILTKSNSTSEYKYNAVFARLRYNLNGKYFINLNGRRDGSSRFGQGNQFGNFGSVAAAWIFSEEAFIKNKLSSLSFGKLRFSYGTSGNDGIGDYQYLEQYQRINTTPYQGVVGYQTTGLFNPYYHWETTKKLELGLETGFFKDRIFLTISYFINRSNDQLINYPTPTSAGYGTLVNNLPALIQNTGIEFLLNTINIKYKYFNWTSSFNITANRNKLIKYPDLQNSAFAQARIGQPFYGYIDVYRSAGVDPTTGLYQFQDKDGKIVGDPNTNDFPKYGRDVRISTAPKFYGGFSNSFNYKSLSLDIFLQFTKQIGVNPLYQQVTYPGASRSNQLAEIYGQQWQKAGDETNFMKFSTTGKSTIYQYIRTSDLGYTDASFIRLKNVSLSYTLPNKLKEKMRLKNLRLYLQGQNLYTFTKYNGFDPETQSLRLLPPLRVITFGINATL